MNKWIGMGRLTRDPEIRYTQGNDPMCVARYTLAVDRRVKKDGQDNADFINCVAFGKAGEFVEKYCKKGTKLAVSGRIQTGSYTNRDGQKVYTTDVMIEEQEFAESKNSGHASKPAEKPAKEENGLDGFMNIPDGIEDGESPFA
jgi:single-strand binding protein